MIPAEECMQEKAFSYLPHGETVTRHFAMGRMQARIARLKDPEAVGILCGVTPVLHGDAGRIYRYHGVEHHRIRRLIAHRCRDPITYLDWGDGTQVLADGNHRYLAAYCLGEPTIRMMIVPPSFWSLFEIDMSRIPGADNPEAFRQYVKSGFSGIV